VWGAVEDYPRTLVEFEARFATDEACRAYLCQLRWPEGFRCPRCGAAKAWLVRTVRYECAACGSQTSVTAGTIFQDLRTPLTMWFRAMWCVASQRTGTSARALQQSLGFGSYQTAWTWLHKLRRAMVRPDRDRLAGRVEVDETYFGGEEAGLDGRGALKKALIVVAAEAEGRHRIGRIRLRRVPNASADSLQGFIDDVVEPGSMVHTDGWLGYDRLLAAPRVPTSHHVCRRSCGTNQRAAASGPSGRVAAQALALGNAPRCREPCASRLLPR
jgi:transposase-like protein